MQAYVSGAAGMSMFRLDSLNICVLQTAASAGRHVAVHEHPGYSQDRRHQGSSLHLR